MSELRLAASDIELLLKLMNLVHMFPIILRDYVALFYNQEAAERAKMEACLSFLRLPSTFSSVGEAEPWITAQTGNFGDVVLIRLLAL